MQYCSRCGVDFDTCCLLATTSNDWPRAPTPLSISAWGDSLTAGMGASSWRSYYPSALAALTNLCVINNGIPGQCSRSIAARQGGVPALLTFEDNTMRPGAGNVVRAEWAPLTAWSPPAGLRGTVRNISGVLKSVDPGSKVLVFEPSSLGAPLAVPPDTAFIPDSDGQRDNINVLWMGRNNASDPDRVIADVRACIQHVRSGRVIVLSVINGEGEGIGTLNHRQILAINHRLAALPGAVFVDVRALLVAACDPRYPLDTLRQAQDMPSISVHPEGDGLHLNDKGYAIVAQAVAQAIERQGWLATPGHAAAGPGWAENRVSA